MGRIRLALAAGAGAFVVAMVGYSVGLIAAFMAADPSGSGALGVALLAAAPAVLAAGGALPLRAFGLGWGRAIVVALACHYAVGTPWLITQQARTLPLAIGAPTSIPPKIAVQALPLTFVGQYPQMRRRRGQMTGTGRGP